MFLDLFSRILKMKEKKALRRENQNFSELKKSIWKLWKLRYIFYLKHTQLWRLYIEYHFDDNVKFVRIKSLFLSSNQIIFSDSSRTIRWWRWQICFLLLFIFPFVLHNYRVFSENYLSFMLYAIPKRNQID